MDDAASPSKSTWSAGRAPGAGTEVGWFDAWRAGLLLALAMAWSVLAWGQGTAGPVVKTDQVRAELLAHAPEGIAPGRTVWLGLAIDHAPQWHTYWRNPGDSGLPTTLTWQLPPEVQAGDIEWPTPHKLPVGPLMNFGHEGQLLLPVRLTIGPGFAGSSLRVALRADWLVCKDVCIPEGGDFALELPTGAAIGLHGARFEAALASRPVAAGSATAQARVGADAITIEARGLPAAWRGQDLNLFPTLAGVIDNAAKTPQRWDGDTWQVQVPLSPQRSESPSRLEVVLAPADTAAGIRPVGLQLAFDVQGSWPVVAAAPVEQASALPDGAALDTTPPAVGGSLGMALLFALAGGVLLNLMPCVFPVLSLKVVGFTAHAGRRGALLAGGLAYTAGVVLSFLALAGLLLVLRAGGEQLGWGFQLQSPPVVAALAVLFTLIGLNLAGLYELRSLLPSAVAASRLRHPRLDDAWTGVLAVAVAAPCTAPFMGASLGWALTMPAWQALSVFAALGLGMALPYLALSAWPGLGARLPRPGPWMVSFKALLAFPMFGTVIWLVWVLGQQSGVDAVAGLLGVLLAVAFGAWALGRDGVRSAAKAGWAVASVLVVAGTLAWAWPAWHDGVAGPAGAAGAATRPGDRWAAWSAEGVRQAQAEGRTVFVDYTAAWCVTCQYNKRTVLQDAALLADLEAQRVLLLRADWTRRDAAISAELSRLGRSGVPVYAVYRPRQAMPQLLSELPSASEIRAAVAGGTAL